MRGGRWSDQTGVASSLIPVHPSAQVWLCVSVIVGFLIRAWIVYRWQWNEPNGDEAVAGLMAKHIAQARDFPVFFYGQSYLGALEPYLNAVLFRLFGFSPNLIFVLPTLFSTALIWLVYKFAGCFYGPDVAISAAAVVAVAPVDMLQRTLSAAGGFALAALLELVAVWLFIRLYAADRPRLRVAFVFSAVSGLACWVWQIYVPVFVLLVAIATARGSVFAKPTQV